MPNTVKPIPDGYHTVTPYIVVTSAAQAIEFYRKAFGAENTVCMKSPDGKIMHAEIKIGNSIVMLGEESPQMGCVAPVSQKGSTVSFYIYVRDADAAFQQAVKAGAETVMPVSDMFWGDRHGQVKDPFGHRWSLATHKEDLTDGQIRERAMKAFAQGK